MRLPSTVFETVASAIPPLRRMKSKFHARMCNLLVLVGARGFEPPASTTPLLRATRLRHAPPLGTRDRNRTCNLRFWRPLLCLIELPAFSPVMVPQRLAKRKHVFVSRTCFFMLRCNKLRHLYTRYEKDASFIFLLTPQPQKYGRTFDRCT
jgi:hypothetical protein